MESLKCSIGTLSSFVTTGCNLSTRYPNEKGLRKLNECSKSISLHLTNLAVNVDDFVDEGHLIAVHSGIFEASTDNLSMYTVCPYHRDVLGISWQKRSTCQFPSHKGKAKPYRSVSLKMSRRIFASTSSLVQVGSGICRKCINQVYALPDIDESHIESKAESKQEENGHECNQHYYLRDHPVTLYEEQFSSQGTSTGQCSQLSSWSHDENTTGLDTYNSIIEILPNSNISPLKYQLQRPLMEITPQSKNYIIKKSSQLVNSLLEVIAPGQSKDLLRLIAEPQKISSNKDEEILTVMMDIYNTSTHNIVKDQILSIMAGLTTKDDIMKRIPALTKYHVEKVRAVTPDEILMKENEPPKKRQRMDPSKLEHCLSFFFNPSFHQLVSHGIRKMELDTGESIVIPDVVRTACHASIIDMYDKYCRDNNFTPLSRASLFRILHSCSASKRHNLHGLDNITADGLASFKTVIGILKALEDRGVLDRKNKDNLSERLRDGQTYLKRDFKLHITLDSNCIDHCIRWACSDQKDKQFQSLCDHAHDNNCQDCHSLQTVLDHISTLDLNEDETVEFTEAKYNIEAWRAHILRTINQDRGRIETIDHLKPNQILIVMDWAMKFLPLLHREKQSDWFGQKGISWHVAVGITRDNSESLKHTTWVHILETGKQDWFSVASILENTLQAIKKQSPEMMEAFVRSDNAGCYHNGFLWSSIPGICERTGLQVKRYNFSEAQAGKSYCDAKIAHLRQKMRVYVANGNDIKTPSDMKVAIDSNGGVVGCRAAVVEVNYSNQNIFTHKWKDVSFITDLEVQGSNIRAFKAFGIGEGKLVETPQLIITQQNSTALKVVHNFTTPEKHKGEICQPNSIKESVQCFKCSEEGCVQSFCTFEQYEEHMYFGKHTFEMNHKMSTYDRIKLRWAENCNLSVGSSTDHIVMPTTSSNHDTPSSSSKGWALKKERRQVRFKQQVKDFLRTMFISGENSGKRANSVEVAAQMRSMTDEQGYRIFSPQDCLKPSQITSYFSRLSSMSKKENSRKENRILAAEDDEYFEHILNEIEIQEIKDNVNS